MRSAADARARGGSSIVVARPHQLADRGQLDVARPLVDRADLRIAVELFGRELSREADAAQPVDALRGDVAGHLGRLQLGHGGLLDEGPAALLQPRRVVHQEPRGLDFHPRPGVLELHALEVRHRPAELLPRANVPQRIVVGALGEANHLGADADAALVEEADGHLIPLADLAQHRARGHATGVEVQLAGRRGADAQLVLLLADLQAGVVALHHKSRDAAVRFRRIGIGEDDEEPRLHGVGDPALAPLENPVAAVLPGPRLQREGVRAALRLR
mmetsp:Transcript_107946/g.300101  ORF Transcript_107946/g.300101 Transcript_107946/m.300101 type:complete len:273 (+) Transcript_107946:390-1208(+)